MITFDSLTLKAFVKENKDFLADSRIQKIQQPTRRDFVFTIRKAGETRKLYININPQLFHVCFMSKQNELKRFIQIPQKPPMFCMLLRKYLENARIAKVNQPPYERILEFYIETFNELSEKIYLCLAIELMGKHSNVVLYNYDTNVILGCAHNVGTEKSREREMAGTLPYVYPPKQNKIDIENFNGDIDYTKLSGDFFWFSNSFAKQCQEKCLDKLKSFVRLENLSPKISSDYSEFTLFSELLDTGYSYQSVNEMIDEYFAYHIEKSKFNEIKNHLHTKVIHSQKKLKSSLGKMQSRLVKDADFDKNRLYGDLIMANLYNNKDFQSNIIVFDYENNKELTIQLDKDLTLKENANKFYKLYNKAKTSRQKISELAAEIQSQLSYFEQILYSIEQAQSIADLLEIKHEIEPEQVKMSKDIKSASMPLELQLDGCRVFVGKNNRQNDYIVSKLSKDDDYWFHIKDCAGSHVLLKSEVEPDEKLIYECAKLAKEYSSAKDSLKAGVIYTKSKYLKKPPKAALGYVIYKNEKEIVV